jgi:TolB-like protein
VSAIIQGFEYDIFISYRHNDNLEGWVTDFVQNLERELKAMVKEPLTIYFDKNPVDGLLEIHNVDKSLEGKLRCLIFVPIISQTYCDKNSFAWQHEFCAFNKLAKEDQFGREVTVSNGNVVSRILPVKIHSLDLDDNENIVKELGTALRAIEFIYKEPGVNRPLKQGDTKSENQNKTDYRNQINKVANAVKEVLHGLQFPISSEPRRAKKNSQVMRPPHRRKFTMAGIALLVLGVVLFLVYYLGGLGRQMEAPSRSIAVLPFENMNNDPDQDYFSSGMTEDILNHLVKISDLQVKSRTSTLQYKATTKTASEIGEELGVANIVEGSVRKVGDKVRIVVQLIDAKRDVHLWSETFDRPLDDILNLQSEIAIQIAKTLEAKLTSTEREQIQKEETQDVTAYDYYLRAREEANTINYSKSELLRLKGLVDRAIEKDPSFAKAYALKAGFWFELSSFGLSQKVWVDSSTTNARRAIALSPDSPDGYRVMAAIHMFLGRMKSYEQNIETAFRLAPNDVETKRSYGWHLLTKGVEKGADLVIESVNEGYTTKQANYYGNLYTPYYQAEDYQSALKIAERFSALSANSEIGHLWACNVYRRLGDYNKSLIEGELAIQKNPESSYTYDNAAWPAFLKGDYAKAAEYWSKYKDIEAKFEDKTQTIPFRHRLAMTYLKTGKTEEAKRLLEEHEKIQIEMIERHRSTGAWFGRGSLFYDLAVCQVLLQKSDSLVMQNLDSALHYQLVYNLLFDKDPAFEKIKDTPAFKRRQAVVDEYYAFRKRAFTQALARAQASKDLKYLLDR